MLSARCLAASQSGAAFAQSPTLTPPIRPTTGRVPDIHLRHNLTGLKLDIRDLQDGADNRRIRFVIPENYRAARSGLGHHRLVAPLAPGLGDLHSRPLLRVEQRLFPPEQTTI